MQDYLEPCLHGAERYPLSAKVERGNLAGLNLIYQVASGLTIYLTQPLNFLVSKSTISEYPDAPHKACRLADFEALVSFLSYPECSCGFFVSLFVCKQACLPFLSGRNYRLAVRNVRKIYFFQSELHLSGNLHFFTPVVYESKLVHFCTSFLC